MYLGALVPEKNNLKIADNSLTSAEFSEKCQKNADVSNFLKKLYLN